MLWVHPLTRIVSIGIQPNVFERHSRAQEQKQDNWCWAACVEMVATFLGFKGSSQAEIVEDTFGGWQENLPGTVGEVKTALESLVGQSNKRFVVNGGVSSQLDATNYGKSELGDLISDVLTLELPVIAFIGPNRGTGHCVVVTEICYRTAPKKEYNMVRYFDPWPNAANPGRAKETARPWSLFCKDAQYFVRFKLS